MKRITLRTLEEYLKHCDEIERDTEKSIEHGVNGKSILTSLEYFDLCSGAHIMHDVLEGILQYEAKLLLVYFVNSKVIKQSRLNHILKVTELGYMEVCNRSSPIDLKKEDKHLQQNGIKLFYARQFNYTCIFFCIII